MNGVFGNLEEKYGGSLGREEDSVPLGKFLGNEFFYVTCRRDDRHERVGLLKIISTFEHNGQPTRVDMYLPVEVLYELLDKTTRDFLRLDFNAARREVEKKGYELRPRRSGIAAMFFGQ